MTTQRSITERPNPLSSDIDLASPVEIVRILRQADSQMFSGFLGFPGLFDSGNLATLAGLLPRFHRAMKTGCVVMSGAGTSGRLAMFAARTFNACLGTPSDPDRPPVRYLMAGGEAALVQAQEGAEDDPQQGVADLERVAGDCAEVLTIGITCGMSAPYIAGQMEHALARSGGHAVLLGFNPVELARDTPIEGYPHTFRKVARMVEASPSGTILNPVIGPEPVTGSTRMKSGSMTKILLEVLFHAARTAPAAGESTESSTERVVGLLRAYEDTVRTVYLQADRIAALVEAAGSVLRSRGHIYYVGTAGLDPAPGVGSPLDAGILGLVDASECPPTYGANFEDVRGFVSDGWSSLLGADRPDLEERGAHYRFSIAEFCETKLPAVTPTDLVVCIGDFAQRGQIHAVAGRRGAQVATITWGGETVSDGLSICLPIGPHPVLGWGPLQLGIKLVLNALTTGGHVLAGKVFGNRMVDLRISNNKLFHRTVGIIGDLIGVGPEEAAEALLRSVFETDSLTESQRNAPISECIEKARTVDKVVPKALLMATGRYSCREAGDALARNPVVRGLLAATLA